MKKRVYLVLLSSLAMCLGVMAHEFWIAPGKTKVKVGEKVSLQLLVGENFTGERWQGNGDRVIRYKHFGQRGVVDLLNSIPKNTVVDLLDFTPTYPGTHMLVLETNNNFIELEPDKFEAYLKEDGLTEALKYREEHGEQQENGKEFYRRCAKLLIQAGDLADETSKSPTRIALDIIPQENPFELKKGKPLSFKVYYEEKPLSKAMVKCWFIKNGVTSVDVQSTGNNGVVSFEPKGDGRYMISVVHMVRLKHDPEANWQSTWGSLVFGMNE